MYSIKVDHDEHPLSFSRFDNLPKSNEEQANSCDGPITLVEATEVVKNIGKNKSRGSDGITTECYHFFGRLVYYFFSINGTLIQLDFAKAFDSVMWDYMYGVLAKFNFGEDLIKWIKACYTKIYSHLMNNGYTS